MEGHKGGMVEHNTTRKTCVPGGYEEILVMRREGKCMKVRGDTRGRVMNRDARGLMALRDAGIPRVYRMESGTDQPQFPPSRSH